jgi:hypothetical protein
MIFLKSIENIDYDIRRRSPREIGGRPVMPGTVDVVGIAFTSLCSDGKVLAIDGMA